MSDAVGDSRDYSAGDALDDGGMSTEIFERGYRKYEGERTGVSGAMSTVFVASVQRALGLRRKFRFKVVPIFTLVLAYLPAIGFMAFAILLPEQLASEVVAEYADYFGLILTVMVLFTAFVAPELLSVDRQTGMLGLYLSSPLTKNRYLTAKITALFAVLLGVTLFPVLFLLVGYSVTGLGPSGFGETLKLLARVLVSGASVAVFFAIIGMAVSTLTPRRGFASIGIVILLVASSFVTNVLVEQADGPSWLLAFSLLDLPLDIVARIYDERNADMIDISSATAWGAWLGVCAVGIAIIVFGYRRLQVTK